MTNAVDFEKVSASYHDSPVLREITFSLRPGEMVAVIGPNGAGKTTLLRVLAGLKSPASGTVRLLGDDITRISSNRRARLLAVVPQELQVPVAFTVEELVMIGRTASMNRWAHPSPADFEAVERAMTYTDVADLRKHPVTELSGGEKQRAAIALALAQEPEIILLDEVTSHLDLNHQIEIMLIIERLNTEKNVTVVMTSHNLNIAAECCKRLLLLDGGRLAADGAPSEVLREDLLKRVFRCDVRVNTDPVTGQINVAPAKRMPNPRSGQGIRVHVIGGGGSAQEIMRRLCLCGYAVSSGVINSGDTDAQTAAALGIDTALEKPFSPVSAEPLRHATAMALAADAVVLGEVYFGPGNLPNLGVAEAALAAGKRVLVMDAGLVERDFTPSKEACVRVRKMIDQGAMSVRSITDLFSDLAPNARPAQ